MAGYDIIISLLKTCFYEEMLMTVSYNGLWKLLIDKGLKKQDLVEKIGLSSSTVAKMGKGENVSMDVLQKICDYLDCNVGDIMSFEKDDREEG